MHHMAPEVVKAFRKLEGVSPNLYGNLLRSIWLFTRSDLKTIVGPSTLFGVATAAAQAFDADGVLSQLKAIKVITRSPIVLFWVWINLLPFAIDNQRDSAAIAEDQINKPWRPMPSKMLSQSQAKGIMLLGYAISVLTSCVFGGLVQCLSLLFLGIWYNELGGSDSSCFVRNMINGLGYMSFISGALQVASAATTFPFLVGRYSQWVLLLGAVVFTTVHLQDMYDQDGDAARGRKTVPLQLGDLVARCIVGVMVPLWSAVCPKFWCLSASMCVPYVALGVSIALRSVYRRTIQEDRNTFRLWNLWVALIYLLPLIAAV